MTAEQQQSLCHLIRQLGAQAQQLRDSGLHINQKARQDFVSEADLFVEQQLKAWVQTHRPQDGFLGEEGGLSDAEQGIWVVDPIDGTSNFILGMDYWCISVAYVRHNVIELGIIFAPDRNEFFIAIAGEGAYLNDRRLTIKEPAADAVVIGLGRSSRTPPGDYTSTLDALLSAGIEYRRFGAGALMLAHVAAGQLHGYYEAHLNSWDALAGLLLIAEAGGIHSTFLSGTGLLHGNPVWAACPEVYQRLYPVLSTDSLSSRTPTK